MTAYAFLNGRDTRNQTAPGIGMTVHAVDLHPALVFIAGMAKVGELYRLLDRRAHIIRPINARSKVFCFPRRECRTPTIRLFLCRLVDSRTFNTWIRWFGLRSIGCIIARRSKQSQ